MSEIWYQKACTQMVRENKSLYLVSNENDLKLTKGQCDGLEKDPEFQRVLRGERLRFYKELASDPNRSKQTNIGNLLFIADQLIAKGMYDKAATVVMSIMKAEGQLEDKTAITVFGDISEKDLSVMRDVVAKRQKAELAN